MTHDAMLRLFNDLRNRAASIALAQEEAFGAKLAPKRTASRGNNGEGLEWAVTF